MVEARWSLCVVLGLIACSHAQSAMPTLCQEEGCRCDSFTRVICNCNGDSTDITLRPDGAFRVPAMTSGIIIDGCAKIQFLPETIRSLAMLRIVELRNIDKLFISESSLAWTPFANMDNSEGIKILIENTTVTEISSYAIQGHISSIIINHNKLKTVRPFAFSSLTGVSNIELTNNEFENIDLQTFKKFTTTNFLLSGGAIKTLPSRFLSDVEVTNLFRIDSVTVQYISSLSFIVSMPQRVVIENNIIDILEGDSFSIQSRGPITFRNNTVTAIRRGAFLGFSVAPEVIFSKGQQELLIDNTTVSELSPSSLIYNQTSLVLRFNGLNLNSSCSCKLADEWQEMQKEQGGVITCWYALDNHFVSLPTFMDSRCGTFKQTFWIVILVGGIIVSLIAVVVVVLILKKENEKKKKLQIVMPEGKTYRETELHIVVERAELLTTDL